jgi:hypothetical protein
MSSGNFVLILKCTEASTVPAAASGIVAPVKGEDTNMYEKIHMYKIMSDGYFNDLKNIIKPSSTTTATATAATLTENDYNNVNNNHAIIFIKLTNNEIDTKNGYIEKKYFKYDDIRDNFITQIDTTSLTPNATEMNCYKSTYEIKGIKPSTDTSTPYAGLTLDKPTTTTTATNNILINNGGKIVVTSSKNDDQLILHYVSKMFGFEDIMNDLGGNNTVSRGGGGDVDDEVEGGENNDFTAEELAEYQNQMEQQQNLQGGKKKRYKQNTKKRNQK